MSGVSPGPVGTAPPPARTLPRRRPHRAYLSLAVVLAAGAARMHVYKLADRFRTPSPERARAVLAPWCRRTCSCLGLQVRVNGTPFDGRCLYVANHRSYLDILVLMGVLRATFLSRADVATWPLIGTLARLTGTVMVERDDLHDRMRATRALLRQVRRASVVVFPEGTTTGEPLPRPFRPGVFRLMRRLSVPVVPVTLRYSDRRAYWVDDVTPAWHLRSHVLHGAPLRVVVDIGSAVLGAPPADAQQLSAAVYAAVCRPIETSGELV